MKTYSDVLHAVAEGVYCKQCPLTSTHHGIRECQVFTKNKQPNACKAPISDNTEDY